MAACRNETYNRPHFDVALATTEPVKAEEVRDKRAEARTDDKERTGHVVSGVTDADADCTEENLRIALRETFPGSDPIGFYR